MVTTARHAEAKHTNKWRVDMTELTPEQFEKERLETNRKNDEQYLAEQLFVSMMGNSYLVNDRDPKWIMKEALSLATVFKGECRGRFR